MVSLDSNNPGGTAASAELRKRPRRTSGQVRNGMLLTGFGAVLMLAGGLIMVL